MRWQSKMEIVTSDGCRMMTGTNTCEDLPCCILWVVIPGLTCACPVVGHTMITDSQGQVYDFAGWAPGAGRSGVCKNLGIFGAPVRFLKVSPASGVSEEAFREAWDEGVLKANKAFDRQLHMAVIRNCHSHVATALNSVAGLSNYPKWFWWNVLTVAIGMVLWGSWIPGRGSCLKVYCVVWLVVALWFVLPHLRASLSNDWVQGVPDVQMQQ